MSPFAPSPRRPRGHHEKPAFVLHSTLYQEFLAEREEILRHKWLLSEKAGLDVGFERALLDWCRHHRTAWRRARRRCA